MVKKIIKTNPNLIELINKLNKKLLLVAITTINPTKILT